MSDLGFDPLDQEFLSVDAIRHETMQALAQLELEKHRLRMRLTIHDGNGDAQATETTTISQELAGVEAATAKIKEAYGSILYPNAPVEDATVAADGD